MYILTPGNHGRCDAAVIDSGGETAGSVLAVGDIVLDTVARTAKRAGISLALGRKEYELLEYLMHHAGMPCAREVILEKVWNGIAESFTNTVDVHISLLRGKIDHGRPKAKRMIKTIYGYGYSIEEGGA